MPDSAPWRAMGYALIVAGALLLAAGLALVLLGRWPWIGRLPGDLLVRRGRFTLFVPITTMILLSIVLTLLLNLFRR